MMLHEDAFQFVARIEELRRGWPMLLADVDLGRRFHELLKDEELEAVFREFKVSAGPSA
jgi:hypothetical protein